MPTFMGPAEGTVANGECCECGEGTPGNCLFCDIDAADNSEIPDVSLSGVSGNYCCDYLNSVAGEPLAIGSSGCNYEWRLGDFEVCQVVLTVFLISANTLEALLDMRDDPACDCCVSSQAYQGTIPDPCICEDGSLTVTLSKSGDPSQIGDCECVFPETMTVSVAPHNAFQQISRFGTVLSGTGTLTFDGQTTGTIAFNASAATIQTALEGLSNIAPGDVSATGGPLGTAAIDVEFTGALAERNVPLLTSDTTGFSCVGACGITVTSIHRGFPYCYP